MPTAVTVAVGEGRHRSDAVTTSEPSHMHVRRTAEFTSSARLVAAAAAAVASAVLVRPAAAQTSGTVSTSTPSTWTTAPWMITSGTGSFPDDGGSATWATAVATPGNPAGPVTLTLDKPITLSTIVYDSPFALTIDGTAADPLVLAATGATLDDRLSPANPPNLFLAGHTITAPVAGGGTAGLTKAGVGNAYLNGTVASSTYTGGTHVTGGVLAIGGTAAIGDGVLGATGAGNGISLDAGTLFNNITGGWTTNRDVYLGTAGGTLDLGTAATVNGTISGPGALVVSAPLGLNTLTLTTANTYAGATTVRGRFSGLTLAGNGSALNSPAYDVTGTVTLDNTAANLPDRLADAAPVTLRGANLTLTGNASAASSESVGATTLTAGVSTLTVTPGSGTAAALTVANLTRSNYATLYVRGPKLGNAPAAGIATIRSTVAPALVGGTGAAGSTTIPIVPWAVGNVTSATTFTTAGIAGASLVTYSDATGFRPLSSTEYAAAFGGNATDNVRLTATTTAGAGTTANAVVFAPAAAATVSGGTVMVTSGTFLYAPTTSSVTGTVSAGLDFGAAEGVITTANTLNLSGPIAGSAGVTYTSLTATSLASTPVIVTGANTYTGDTRVNSGNVRYSGAVAGNGTAGPFGSNGAVVLNAGTNFAAVTATAESTLNRDVNVVGSGPNAIATSNAGFTSTYNGNVTLSADLIVFGYGAGTNPSASAMTFNGRITGPGAITDSGQSYVVLNGDNTYGGGTTMALGAGSTFVAGSDRAFGTGTVYLSNPYGPSALAGSGTAPRTLANNLFLSSLTDAFAGTAPLTFTGTVNLNGLAANVQVNNTAPTTFAGVIANGGMNKSGGGVVVLTGANTYTGGTNVLAGSIRVDNATGSGTGAGGVLVSAGGTLGGTGRVAGAVAVAGGGTITAGASDAAIGTLTTGAEAWAGNASGGGYLVKTDGATADQLVMSGLTVTATAAAPFLVTAAGNVRLTAGQQLLIATDTNTSSPATANPFAAALAAGSLTLNLPATTVQPAAGQTLGLFAGSDAGGDFTLYLVSAPEPTSLVLGATAAAPLMLGRSRRRATRRRSTAA